VFVCLFVESSKENKKARLDDLGEGKKVFDKELCQDSTSSGQKTFGRQTFGQQTFG
jgi:hypothetical protein